MTTIATLCIHIRARTLALTATILARYYYYSILGLFYIYIRMYDTMHTSIIHTLGLRSPPSQWATAFLFLLFSSILRSLRSRSKKLTYTEYIMFLLLPPSLPLLHIFTHTHTHTRVTSIRAGTYYIIATDYSFPSLRHYLF